MHLILRYPSGRLADAILLAAATDRVRIVVRRLNETIELHLTDGQWFSEGGEAIQIEGWLTDGKVHTFEWASRFNRRVSTAAN